MPMTTRLTWRSVKRAAHSNFGGLRSVQGSKVTYTVVPVKVSFGSFFSSRVYSP